MRPKVYVAPCALGRGIFAAQAIRQGETILIFAGPLISYAEALAKGEQASNPLQVGPGAYIDCISPGVFTNHSCDPNAGVSGDALLVALRDIAEGEEVRMDYSTTVGQDDPWTMRCRCGSPRCRGTVAPFDTLPPDLRLRYAALGVIPRFIREAADGACRGSNRDQSRARSRVYVAGCRLGKGVFALEDIAAGEVAFEFTGRTVTKAEVIAKGEREGDPLQLGYDIYLDPDEPGLSINHSCDPNGGVIRGTALVAIRPIRRGEEVTMDYSTTIGTDDGWTMTCLCGLPCCRRLIGAFAGLPFALRRRYLDLGVVPEFIASERDAEASGTAVREG